MGRIATQMQCITVYSDMVQSYHDDPSSNMGFYQLMSCAVETGEVRSSLL